MDAWVGYYHLKRLELFDFFWTYWTQRYWPFVHSLYQLPFYALLGTFLLAREWRGLAPWPATVFLALLTTSPFLLAYGSLAMMDRDPDRALRGGE